MKGKYLRLLSLALLLITIAGCSNQAANSDKDSSNKRIGILQIVEHPSLNSIREAIIAQLAVDGFTEGDNLTIDYQNAQGDQNNLKSIAQKFVQEDYDAIIAIATPSAQAIAGETQQIPIIFAAVTDPVSAGLLKNLDSPEGNITGTSDIISAEQNLLLQLKITPAIHKLGVIYNSSETASQLVVKQLKEYLQSGSQDIQLQEATVTSTSEVDQVVHSLIGKVDAIFAPIDNTIASSMPIVAQIAIDAKLPLYVGADSMVKDGGLAAYGVNYEILGEETADMAAEVLNGKAVKDLPVKVMDSLNVYVNQTTADKIGITLPDEILKQALEVFKN
ncbi:ABC transporter substrate-binding protein [Paenibacillus tepidiphilus]|uniref:ABC transporter substrate-binding protein n=1 Tax=Paenibacillus tepidiphilus TaxID=2608683 RepID=UPI001239C17A|nr:ABC transporter substrate-binding protein [Paenibacillus tepidiphilus]